MMDVKVEKWLDFIAYSIAALELEIDVYELLGEDTCSKLTDSLEAAFPIEDVDDVITAAIKERLYKIADKLLKEEGLC